MASSKVLNYPLDAQVTPRFSGLATFYRLPVQTDLQGLDVADVGDCRVNPFNTMETLDLIHRQIADIYRAGAMPLSFGGDHLISLGTLRGVAEAHGPVAVIQVDAHLDTWDI